ncbi:uncharacterized protein VTP21DRAFT_2278 [Calcarisporiella thermophila]|uniref:uncharacterized protein n=1 Tax=Calcarisporiella thermophila TaxID=911321 RepID=UPI003744777B
MVDLNKDSSFFVSAPGKVILFGEHAVVYGKTAVAGSVNLRSFLYFTTPIGKDVVHLHLPDIEVERRWNISDIMGNENEIVKIIDDINSPPLELPSEVQARFKRLVNGLTPVQEVAVIAFLHLYLCLVNPKRGPLPMSITVRSNLPVGAGLGSSASYSTCIAACLLQANGQFASTVNAPLELINKWAFQAERVIHGNPSGIDNSVATFGGAIMYARGKMEPLRGFQSLRFLLTNTKVPRSTSALVKKAATLREKYTQVIDPIMDSIHNISMECQRIFSDANNSVTNDRQTILTQIEDLIDLNQWLLVALGVGHPALDKVREVTANYAMHSKLTGAGGGGCALTLVRDDTDQSTIDKVKKDLCSQGFDCFQTSVGVPGVQIIKDKFTDRFAEMSKEELEAIEGWGSFEYN